MEYAIVIFIITSVFGRCLALSSANRRLAFPTAENAKMRIHSTTAAFGQTREQDVVELG